MRFQDAVVVVTGAGRGIGKAIADRFRAEGATVIGVGLSPAEGIEEVDVTNRDKVESLFARVGERYGRVDTLVANAGRLYSLTTLTATDQDWNDCLDTNLKSVWICSRAAHPWLAKSDRASIVTIASAQGERSGRASFPYSASKGGLLALTRSLAVEYAPGIRVNCILPGQIESVRTEPFFRSFRDPGEARRRVLSTFPMRRLGKPEDIAGAVAFLASDDASWITGTFLRVDGGRDAAMIDLSDLQEPK